MAPYAQKTPSTSDSSASIPSPSSPSASESQDEILRQKLLLEKMKRSVNARLHFAHISIITTIITLNHAAFTEVTPIHAYILLAICVPLRLFLGVKSQSVGKLSRRPAVDLALTAVVVFTSTGLHLLASRIAPHLLLMFIAMFILEISSAWIRMSVCAKQETQEPLSIINAIIYSFADCWLLRIISGSVDFTSVYFAAVLVRVAWNFIILCTSTHLTIQRDVKRNLANARAAKK